MTPWLGNGHSWRAGLFTISNRLKGITAEERERKKRSLHASDRDTIGCRDNKSLRPVVQSNSIPGNYKPK